MGKGPGMVKITHRLPMSHTILDRFLHAYIMINALDECTEHEKTLNWLNTVISDTYRKEANLYMNRRTEEAMSTRSFNCLIIFFVLLLRDYGDSRAGML